MKSNLKQIMADKGATILGLAEDSGISQRTIQKARDHRIESCTLKTLAAIAKALGCQVKDLFKEEELPRKWAGK